MELFRRFRKKALNKFHVRDAGASTWSSRGFSKNFLQSLSLAGLKGLSHLRNAMVTAAGLRVALS